MKKHQCDSPRLQATKRKVKCLHSLLKLRIPDIKLGECYEIVSKTEGYKDWNTMSAVLNGTRPSPLNAERIVSTVICKLGSEEAAFQWLDSTNPALDGKKPVDIWGTEEGGRKVLDTLV